MRKLLLLLSFFSFVYANSTYVINVKNMGCNGCATKIKNATNKIAKLEDFKPDFKTKDVVLEFSSEVDIDKIVEEINKIGYKAVKK